MYGATAFETKDTAVEEVDISATVSRVLSFSEGDFRVLFTEEDVTLVGSMPEFVPGMLVEAVATREIHPKYGERYRVVRIRDTGFASKSALVDYLGGPAFRDIGYVIARSIVDTFGIDAVTTIDQNPNCLGEVYGIGPKRLQNMKEDWEKSRTVHLVVTALLDLGFTSTRIAMKIWDAFGRRAVDVAKEDPYRLLSVDGVTFPHVDHIAMRLGVPSDSPTRISAGVTYVLTCALNGAGHCYLPIDDLLRELRGLLRYNIATPDVMASVVTAKHHMTSVNPEYAALLHIRRAEQNVAAKLLDLAEGGVLYENREEMLRDAEVLGLLRGLDLAPEQVDAIYHGINHRLSVITGGPGTGKTTILKIVCGLLRRHGLNITLCAPTGRAAKRLSESAGFRAATIHRTIELTASGSPQKNAENPLDTDALIVDEMSMLDILLAEQLLDAVETGTRLVLIGDKSQLPSVGPGYVLHDIIESRRLPVTRLTKIFRQDLDSSIVSVAHDILHGVEPHLPEFTGFVDGGCAIVSSASPEMVSDAVLRLMRRELPLSGFDIGTAKILSPMKKRDLGTGVFNPLLQEALNEEVRLGGRYVQIDKSRFYVGDVVMQTRNNYSKDCFNGETGVVYDVNPGRREVSVQYPDKHSPVVYEHADLDQLMLAYACTVHKSQGSEYPIVVLVMHPSQNVMLARKVLYTGLTRARRMCVIVGTRDAVMTAIRNDQESKRNTMLGRFLKDGQSCLLRSDVRRVGRRDRKYSGV